MTFDDVDYGIVAQPDLAPDQAISCVRWRRAPSPLTRDGGFRPLPGLTAQSPAACLCRGDAGADALLDQLTFEVRNAGDYGCHHAAVRRVEVEGQAG